MPAIARFDLSGKYNRYLVGAILALAVIFAGFILYLIFPGLRNLFVKKAPAPSANIPTCQHPAKTALSKGFQSWNFSYGPAATGPKIQTAAIDTLTPPAGSTQTLTLTAKNDTPITGITATIYTDTKTQVNSLDLTKGSATNGTWVGIWKLDDTTDCIYHIDFNLISSGGNGTGGLSFR